MTVNEFYDEVYSKEVEISQNKFLETYESNIDLFDISNINGDSESYYKVMRLTSDYAHLLAYKENYKKALPVIEKAIKLYQTYPEYKNSDLYEIEFYEVLVFDRAESNYILKRYKEAKQDLKILTTRFPENGKYRNWFASAQVHSIQVLQNILMYVVAASVLTVGFLHGKQIGVFYGVMIYLGATALITDLTLEVVRIIKKRKIKNGA